MTYESINTYDKQSGNIKYLKELNDLEALLLLSERVFVMDSNIG